MEATHTISDQLTELFSNLPDHSEDGNELRQKAVEGFLNKGFPTKKNEEYKYTPIDTFVKKNLKTIKRANNFEVTPQQVDSKLYAVEEAHHLVFVNGNYQENLSKISSDQYLEIRNSSDLSELNRIANPEMDVFVTLNTASTDRFLTLNVQKGQQALPVFIYHFVSNEDSALYNARVIVTANESSELKIVEKVITEGNACLLNKITEIDVLKNASVNYTIIQDNPVNVLEINGLKVRQERDSRFYSNTFSFKGTMIRNNINIDLDEENCETHMHGLYLLNGKTHVDNHTSVDHKKANSYSNEVYKGIVDEHAHGVFNGKIYVRPQAQQTNAFQSNNNINLSDTASINTKPQLEIWADDVKCSHGCTVGQLDEEAVFYLRSRGIGERAAKAMLLVAFAEESFEYVPFEFLKEELHTKINQRLIK